MVFFVFFQAHVFKAWLRQPLPSWAEDELLVAPEVVENLSALTVAEGALMN